jgi:hypothetical protein
MGPQGEKGEQGETGNTGSANVIYSDWISIHFDASGHPTIRDINGLTDDILQKGTILVYLATNSNPIGDLVFPLNYYVGANQWFTYYASKGTLDITCGSGYKNSDFYLRYVLIPGGVQANKSASAYNHSVNTPDLKDYNAVTRYYGIPE